MNSWTRIERRWRDALLSALLPSGPGSDGAPGIAQLDLEPFWKRLRAAAPPPLAVGLRLSVWALGLAAPLIALRRARTVIGLTATEREQLLARVASSRWAPARQLTLTLKVVACWAAFADPRVRHHFDDREA